MFVVGREGKLIIAKMRLKIIGLYEVTPRKCLMAFDNSLTPTSTPAFETAPARELTTAVDPKRETRTRQRHGNRPTTKHPDDRRSTAFSESRSAPLPPKPFSYPMPHLPEQPRSSSTPQARTHTAIGTGQNSTYLNRALHYTHTLCSFRCFSKRGHTFWSSTHTHISLFLLCLQLKTQLV
jgi:hypothetical protein